MSPVNDPILVFTLLTLVMLAMPLLADRLRVPDLVLLLFAGLALGPHGAGLLERNEAVTLFGSVGLLYIMFLAGLEIDLHRFARTRVKSVTFGLLTFAIPQCLGTLVGHALLGFAWPTAILLASLLASHTLLAYPIASRLGIARSEPVAVTVGATIIADTLALLVLAVIADAACGMELGLGFWTHIAFGMLGLVLLAWWGIPRLTRWFFQRVSEEGSAQFLFVLVTVCGFAYLSHFAKMEPIIGAFLAGAAFSRLIPERSALMNRVVFAGNTLFIPFFLISVGMLINPCAMLKCPRSWLIAATMVALVIVSKFAAAWLASRLYGYSRDACRVMFGLSVVQAATTLAAVLVGYSLKIFDDTVLNGAIIMIVATCPLGAWLVDRHGRNMAAEAEPRDQPAKASQHVLVPVVNPGVAPRQMDLAFLLRDPKLPGSINPVTIICDEVNIDEAMLRGEKLLAECLTQAASADVAVHPVVRVDVNTSDGITRAAKELHAGLVISGWGGTRSASIRLFGSVMEKLIDACPARLLFCRVKRPFNTTRRLLLLLPPSSERRSDLESLLRDAKNLSRQLGAALCVHLAGKGRPALRARVESAPPALPASFIESETWSETRAKLMAQVQPDDLLFVLGERRVSAHWSPTLDKLSSLLVSRFPNNNLLLAYPALATFDDDPFEAAADPAQDAPRLCACELGAEKRLTRALHVMTATAFPTSPEAVDEARRLLLVSAHSYPFQLPGAAVLLHAHCETIDRPVLIVGLGSAEWTLPDLPRPARLLLALLNPTSSTPERHLRVLADLARRFQDASTVSDLRLARSAAEIVAVLSQPNPKKESHG